MIESNIPQIDVNDLIKQVQVEAKRLANQLTQQENASSRPGPMPPTSALRPFPRMASGSPPDLGEERLNRLHDLLERARQAAELSPRIPKPIRKVFRQQDQYNALLIQSVIPLFETVSKLIRWHYQFAAAWNAQTTWLAEFSRARAEEVDWRKRAGITIGSIMGQLGAIEPKLTAVEQLVDSLRHDLAVMEQRYVSDSSYIKAELALQATMMQRKLDSSIPQKTAVPHDVARGDRRDRQLDAFYLSFENRFRGDREEIKKRVGFYIPFLKKAEAGKADRPVLDLGCGRGEWLEVLRDHGLTGSGVDLNESMVAQCNERRLNANHAEMLEFLRTLADSSHGAVTGFHIIEHLSLQELVSLLGETYRVLQPGGVAIFESPNCKNLVVGASTFNVDPTHRRPVFPDTAQFMLELQGFERVSLQHLTAVDTSAIQDLDQIPLPLRDLLYGPQDFAVIGYKSRAN